MTHIPRREGWPGGKRAAAAGVVAWVLAALPAPASAQDQEAEADAAEADAAEADAAEAEPVAATADTAAAEAPTDDAPPDETDAEPAPPAWVGLPGTELPPFDGPPSEVKRDLPRYDGRPPEGPSVGDALLWVPRTLLFPIHLLFEYLLRRPLEVALTKAEQQQFVLFLYDLFTFGPKQNAGLVPTFFFNFDFRTSVGLFFFHNDAFIEGNDLRVFGGFGGIDWYRVTVADRYVPNDALETELKLEYVERPDYIFSGIGFDVDRTDRARYRQRLLSAEARLRVKSWRSSYVEWGVAVQDREFGNASFRGDPSVQSRIQQGRFDGPPPAFENGYTAYTQRLTLDADSRRPRPNPQSGVRAMARGEHGVDLSRGTERSWVRLDGTVGAYADLGRFRTIGLNVYGGLVEPLGSDRVPFTELVELGGDPLIFGGFLPGILRGRTAAVTTLEYRYPIWVLLDGSFHFSVGNVFGANFDDFGFDRLRMSMGLGFRSGDPDASFTLTVAVGTEPFVEGSGIDSVRVVFGTSPL